MVAPSILALAALVLPLIDALQMPNSTNKITPKVFIINMYKSEAEVWHGISEFDVLARNITIPGFSPLFPSAHCTGDGAICQLITGEGEINAAVTLASLVLNPQFDLTRTYFLIAGVGGINPEVATLGSVTLARYAVQIDLQYAFDTRELPANFSTGYIPQGSYTPEEYPAAIYGTEVFELNDALRNIAAQYARTATLNDSADAVAYRALYKTPDGIYAAGTSTPSVVECDSATSNFYWGGKLLGEAFSNYTKLITNGTGLYCNTQQEDNATLEALLRAAAVGLVDFSRIIIMRTGSDMDRQYPGESVTTNEWWAKQGGYAPALKNLYLAGVKIVEGILSEWNMTFEAGVTAPNYVGDILGTLGGTPNFGPGPAVLKQQSKRKRSLRGPA